MSQTDPDRPRTQLRMHAERTGDPDTILDVARRAGGTTICAFYDGAICPYISYVEKFRAEFDYHIRHGDCDVRPGRARPAAGSH